MTRVLLIVNDTESKPGALVPWLLARDVEFDVRIGPEGGVPEPAALDSYDGVVLLGGGLMPDDVRSAPWLADERALARAALAADVPQLGICLGGQMLAQVAGGRVEAESGAPEKGATRILLTPEGAADPVFAGVRRETTFIESHVDRITELPPGAVLLASSEACAHQAFRVGRAWGTQFHPEAGPENVRRWDAGRLAGLGFDKDVLVTEAEAAASRSAQDAEALVDAWVRVVRGA